MRVTALALTAVSIGFASVASAEEVAPLRGVEAARALAETAIAKAVAGDYEGSFAVLQPHWPLPESEFSQLVLQTTKQRGLLEPRFGKSLGFKLVCAETIADSFHRLTYIEKFENTAIRWRFLFYKPTEVWKVNSVSWDDEVQDLAPCPA